MRKFYIIKSEESLQHRENLIPSYSEAKLSLERRIKESPGTKMVLLEAVEYGMCETTPAIYYATEGTGLTSWEDDDTVEDPQEQTLVPTTDYVSIRAVPPTTMEIPQQIPLPYSMPDGSYTAPSSPVVGTLHSHYSPSWVGSVTSRAVDAQQRYNRTALNYIEESSSIDE